MTYGNTALCFYSATVLSRCRVLRSTHEGQRWALGVNAAALRTAAPIRMPGLENNSYALNGSITDGPEWILGDMLAFYPPLLSLGFM